MLNVQVPIDGRPAPEAAWRSIHRGPPKKLSDRVLQSQILETGIKAIDLLSPIECGGKTGCSAGQESADRPDRDQQLKRRTKKRTKTPTTFVGSRNG
jgi:hypothetical protein